MEQSHLIGPAIMYNYDVHNLYEKIEQDMAEAQHDNGLVPDICPEYITEFVKWHYGYLDSPEESIHRLFTEDMGARWAERAFAKQILFASNTPRFRAFKMRRAIEKLPIIKEVKEDILGGNAVRFLGMEQTYGKA
jgi:hypothetical protein